MSISRFAYGLPAYNGELVEVPWWRDLIERAIRQGFQVAIPIIAAIQVSGIAGMNWRAAALIITVAVALTILKAVAGLQPSPADPAWLQALDRGVPAAAGVIVGFVPTNVLDVMRVNWGDAGWAAAAAFVVAVLSTWAVPPGVTAVTAAAVRRGATK